MPKSTVDSAPSVAPEDIYRSALALLDETGVPYLIGGAYALRTYGGITRDTKDLDVFCKPGDYQRLLETLSLHGYQTSITDANWIAKAHHGEHFLDLIFNSANGLSPVNDTWFEHSRASNLFGVEVHLAPVEGVLWTKMLVQGRYRFDGADVLHIIRLSAGAIDWKRVLMHMDVQWEILLAHLLTFQFVYPSERNRIPRWLMDDLLDRQRRQLDLPVPEERICRGPLLSRTEYAIDIEEWDYQWGYKHSAS